MSHQQPPHERDGVPGQNPGQAETNAAQSSPPAGVIPGAPRLVYPRERERTNHAQYGRSLAEAEAFDWKSALYRPGIHETRATGMLAGLVVVLAFRVLPDECRRITLLRTATPDESTRYFARRPQRTRP
jgi:uncharacterized DUF497 family protein